MSKNFATQFDYLSLGMTSINIVSEVFVSDDGVDGQLIWSVNATATATLTGSVDSGASDTGTLFDPGSIGNFASSDPSKPSSFLYLLYDATLGQQLWRTDGTAGGTSLVMSLYPGPGTKSASGSFNDNNKSVFVSDDGVHGQKIWATDGTTAGTMLLATVDPGTEPAGSEFNPNLIGYTVAANGFAPPYLFVLYDKTLGQQLWRSDGTVGGTQVVETLNSAPGSKSVASFSTLIQTGSGATLVSHEVFVSDDGVHGQQIWTTDGTGGNTQRLATVDSGIEPTGSTIDPVSAATIYRGTFSDTTAAFVLYDKTVGQQLWVSDGTAGGTGMVLNLDPGLGNRNVSTAVAALSDSSLTVLHDVLVTNDGVHGERIWSTDGTSGGTALLATVDSGTEAEGSEFAPSDVSHPISSGSQDTTRELYVLYDQTAGQQLWVTDGTAGGTSLVRDLESGPGVKSYATPALALSTPGN